MVHLEQPYDPPTTSSKQIPAIRAEIEKAIEEMLKNTKKMGERGDHLNTLDEQVRDVSNSASLFKTGANRVRKQMWWKDMRMRMCLFVSVAILLVVIIVPSVIAAKKS